MIWQADAGAARDPYDWDVGPACLCLPANHKLAAATLVPAVSPLRLRTHQ